MALTLYTGLGSGNACRVQLMLYLLDLPYDARQVSPCDALAVRRR